ncbi:hypothetical protein GCM10027258_62390 [Amycolatopsis stemonae]
MGPWACKGCGTAYRLKLTSCPRCHGTEFEEKPNMPKITREGGPSNAAEETEQPQETTEEAVTEDATEDATDDGADATGDESPATDGAGGKDDDAKSDGSEDEDPAAKYNELTVPELKGLLGRRKLPTAGLKDELVARLVEADAAKAEAEAATSDSSSADSSSSTTANAGHAAGSGTATSV